MLKAYRGLRTEMTDLGKDLERAGDEAETSGGALMPAEAEVQSLVSDIDGVS